MIKDVHTEHCCIFHGCKYLSENCTVLSKEKKQSFRCEACDSIDDYTRMNFLVENPELCYDLASKYVSDRKDFRESIDKLFFKQYDL